MRERRVGVGGGLFDDALARWVDGIILLQQLYYIQSFTLYDIIF